MEVVVKAVNWLDFKTKKLQMSYIQYNFETQFSFNAH